MSMSERRSSFTYLHIAIGLFFMFVFGRVVPAYYPITEMGMQVVGVFIGLIWLWCFVGFLWPSLLGLVALALTGFAPMGQVVSMSFGNGVVVLLLFSMVLFGSPQAVGSTEYINRWFLTRKVFNNRPIVFSLIFFLATYALSLAVNVTPALILMWSVLYSLLKDLGYEKGEKYTSLMIVGTFLGAISGQATLPFSGSTLAILGNFETAAGTAIPTAQYMLMGLTVSIIVIVLYALFMKVVCKPSDVEKVAHVNTEMFNSQPLPPMNGVQKANFYVIIIFVILMLLPQFLPQGLQLRTWLNTLGATGVAILMTGLACLIKIDGQPILDFNKVASKAINWDVFVMVAAAMAVASALTNAETGVVDWMLKVFEPLLGGHSPLGFIVVILLFGVFATSFTSAMTLSIALMPILVAFGQRTGANIEATTTLFVLLVHYSIILPSASVFASMLWSNDQWINRKDVFKYGLVIVIIATIVILALIPVALSIF